MVSYEMIRMSADLNSLGLTMNKRKKKERRKERDCIVDDKEIRTQSQLGASATTLWI